MTDAKVLPIRRGRKNHSGWFYSREGDIWTSPYDYALQSEIEENKASTRERSCFTKCETCGHCKRSRRGCAAPQSYDHNAGKTIDCRGCEKFNFCTCADGFLRNTRGEAEPFTEEAQKLFKQGGKPLI